MWGLQNITSHISFLKRLLKEAPSKWEHKPRKTQAPRTRKPTKWRVKRLPRIMRKRNQKTTAVPQPREEPVHIRAGQKAPEQIASRRWNWQNTWCFNILKFTQLGESLRLNKWSVARKLSKNSSLLTPAETSYCTKKRKRTGWLQHDLAANCLFVVIKAEAQGYRSNQIVREVHWQDGGQEMCMCGGGGRSWKKAETSSSVVEGQ